jgi:GcrA cell cycle regulator
MEPSNWAPEHSDALREFLALGLSFSEATRAINRKFETAYSRSAVLGRARRIGLEGHKRPQLPPDVTASPNRLGETRSTQPGTPQFHWPLPADERTEIPKLRCVEIEPRHLSVVDLEHGDCRYPYGGDEEGEAITFCGHPRRPGSSYCAPHFHLSRDPVAPPERDTRPIWLRILETA